MRRAIVAVVLLGAAREAWPCGAAAVSKGSIAVEAQRIFLSVRGGKTEIVVQLVVPESPSDYGALIPLPSVPTVDATPVPSQELDALDRQTQIDIVEDSGGGGCGCGSVDSGGRGPGGVLVGTVDIGPVTAATLRGDDAGAVTGWLAENQFVIPAEQQPLIAEYAGPGRSFLAVKRNGAVSQAPDSLGIHLTLDGDQRGLPLRFTRIGAGERLAFTVFVAAPDAAGPAAPWTSLLVTQLDRRTVLDVGYGEAIADAVAARGSQAWVVEYRAPVISGSTLFGPRLATLVDASQVLTRHSTVLARDRLSLDVDFHGAAPAMVPREVAWGLVPLAGGVVAAITLRRGSRRRGASRRA